MSPATATGPPEPLAAHQLSVHETVLLVETDVHVGLDDEQVTDRLHRYGRNLLPSAPPASWLHRLARQLHSPLIYVLLVAGVIALLLGEQVDAVVIFAVVVLNAVVGFVQESKAEASLEALRELVRTTARVVRGGLRRLVPSEELVPGDVVELEAGDKVPADLRLVREHELEVDESALTGESLPVAKDEVVLPDSTAVADRRNILWSGTLVTGGSGTGVVVATGAGTELGQVHRLIGSADDIATPLTRKLARFSAVLTVVILGLAVVTFAVGMLRGAAAPDMFIAAVALAVAAIPEGLPAAVTVTLAIGVARMARRRAVVRRMPSVETLGSTTVICTDKTGTLTENQMTVRAVWTPAGRYDVTGSGYDLRGEVLDPAGSVADLASDAALRACLLAGVACNDARLVRSGTTPSVIGDPTEAALVVSAAKAGLTQAHVERTQPRSAVIPFSSERKWMATAHADLERAGRRVVYVKGAAEQVLELCASRRLADGSTAALRPEEVLATVEQLAGDGLRVLALAVGPEGDESAVALDERTLQGACVLVGLQAMLDPPRETAAAAVRACRSAGVSVKMITGDHAATAAAIARRVGLVDDDRSDAVLTGVQLAALDPDDWPAAAERTAVFARVSPEQKLLLVRTLQGRGHVVAMTGDGVNDAPALQQADIGVAMGRSGTEVAKDAADVVLTDDDFATIEAAVEEGRGVFDNLTKFLVWTLPTNAGQALVILLAVLAGGVLPVLPVQILWINMTTAVALGLMLAFEPKEPDIMSRPPRQPAQPLLGRVLLQRILLVAVLLVVATSILFRWEQDSGASVAEARTAAVNLFVAVSILYLLACRSLTLSVRHIGLLSNRWVLGGITVQVVAQLCLTYLPVMQSLFDTVALGWASWLRIALLAVLCAVAVAVHKRWSPTE